jgi:hypothetical protein
MRDECGFAEAVTTHFAFLCNEFGFQRTVAYKGALTIVEFVSPHAVIKLFHGLHRGGEIEVCIGRAGGGQESLYPLEHLYGTVPLWIPATTPEEVEKEVSKIATVLLRHGRSALLGDDAAFKKLAAKR